MPEIDEFQKMAKAVYYDLCTLEEGMDCDMNRRVDFHRIATALRNTHNKAVEECAVTAEKSYDSNNHADKSPKHISQAIRRLKKKAV